MKKVNQKIDEDVVDDLHKYRINVLGRKATMSEAIRDLLKRCS